LSSAKVKMSNKQTIIYDVIAIARDVAGASLIVVALLVSLLMTPSLRSQELEQGFLNPPDSAKPRVLWMWMGSNISKAGITGDLEALKAAGFGGMTMFSLADITTPWAGVIAKSPTPGIVAFSDPWWALVRHAAGESARLGLDFGLHNCAGYESSGGPWITPDLSMKELVWSEKPVRGPGPFKGTLARPAVDPRANMPFPVYNPETGLVEKPEIPARGTFYHDIAVLALPAEGIVREDQVIDLTSKMGRQGEIEWVIPAGSWVIYRFGYTTNGSLLQPAQWEAGGLECDKMDPEAVAFHLDHVLGEIRDRLGDLVGRGFTHLHFDSYEAGPATWTPRMREEYRARRGHDLVPWLPVLAKRTIGSAARADKFRADFERTVQDLYRDVFYATASKKIREAGLEFMCEPYGGPWRVEEVVPHVDRVMTEFWTNDGAFTPYELEATVKALRQAGRNVIEAEAFTGKPEFSQWRETPAWLKPIGDAAFCAGVNLMSLHRFVHQPWADRWRPGNTMGQWGTHFDRTQTWWEPGAAWVKYIGRCQFMLQRGKTVEAPGDFSVENVQGGLNLKFIHRVECQSDIYFVANIASNGGQARCAFGVSGRQPELWDPVWGTTRDLPEFETRSGCTVIPLTFAPAQSFFVVFRRRPTPAKAGAKNFPEPKPAAELSGPWNVSFDKKWGGPEKVVFESLGDWTARPEPEIKYFSGTAAYSKTFDMIDIDRPAHRWLIVDLGVVNHLAHIILNGCDLGVVWCAPWRVVVPQGLMKTVGNEIIVEVTNVWANRLIGDEQEPADCVWMPGHMGFGGFLKEFPDWFLKGALRPAKKRLAFTTWNYFTKVSPLEPSGLLGPVRVLIEE
jgi:hypothetical protein